MILFGNIFTVSCSILCATTVSKIFLLNDAGDEMKSIPVTNELKRVVIKASADGFE